MAIKTIEIVNIQSHEYTKIKLNKTGITRFYGENNDGKSVITKMVDYFIREKIKDPRVRKAMIRKTNNCGKLIITKYDGVILTLHLDLEAAKTFVKLERPGQEFDVRYLADKSYPQLIRIAGFHYNKENDITLNVYQTNEPWVFVQTKPTTNYDVLNEAVSDPLVEEGLSNLNKFMKESKTLINGYAKSISNLQSQYAMLPNSNIESEVSIKDRCEYFLKNIEKLDTPKYHMCRKIIDITGIEALNFTIKPPSMNVVKSAQLQEFINSIDILSLIPDITKLIPFIESVVEIQKSVETLVCPTCGRSLM